ncbi:MAG: fibronectin type III domain-containing protein, partial [Bacteroidota bacterium]
MSQGNTSSGFNIPAGSTINFNNYFDGSGQGIIFLESPADDEIIQSILSATYTDNRADLPGIEKARAYYDSATHILYLSVEAGVVARIVLSSQGEDPDTLAPSVPTGLAASGITGTSLVLNWNPSTDNTAVAGYQVLQGGQVIATTGGPSLQVTGLSINTAYTFQVRAFDAAGNQSQLSTILSVTTQDAPDTQAPDVPTGLAFSNLTENSATITWNPSSDDTGIAGYRVFLDGQEVGTTSGTSFDLIGLSPSTGYTVSVSAYDSAQNESAQSGILSFTTLAGPDTIAPITPQGLVATNINTQTLTLSWNQTTDNVGVAGYRVFQDGQEILDTQNIAVNVTGLSAGTLYSFSVQAYDAAGNNSATTTIQVTTQTANTTAPVYTVSRHPSEGDLDVQTTSIPYIEFNRPVAYATGSARLLGGPADIWFGAQDDGIYTIVGNRLYLSPEVNLEPSTTYRFIMDAGMFLDSAGNPVSQILDGDWTFTTEATQTQVSSTELWVDPVSGNDGNDGSQASPFLTIERANEFIGAGGTINLLPGTYRLTDTLIPVAGLSKASPTTYLGPADKSAIIKGSAQVSGPWTAYGGGVYWTPWIPDSQTVFVDGAWLQQIGGDNGAWSSYPFGDSFLLPPVGTDQDSPEMTNSPSWNPEMDGAFYVNKTEGRLYVYLLGGADPSGSLIEAALLPRVVDGEFQDFVRFENVQIRHASLHDAAADLGLCLHTGENGWTLENCTIADASYKGIQYWGRNHDINNCVIERCGNVGIEGSNTDASHGYAFYQEAPTQNIHITNNLIQKNNIRQFFAEFHSGGMKIIPGARGVRVALNTVIDNWGPGIWFDHPISD